MVKKIAQKGSYSAKDIYVLKGLEPVRKRPGMYIGSTGREGLHHLIWECLDNAIDEALAGYANQIEIFLLPNNTIRVTDNGRGIPVDQYAHSGKSALEVVMTTLHAGAKLGSKAYQVAGGLHGVGVSVVCALSQDLRAEVCRGGIRYVQEYKKGKPVSKLKKDGSCPTNGTAIIFVPDPEIFREIQFSWPTILHHLRQQAYLTPGVKMMAIDRREKDKEKDYTFYFDGGLRSYVRYLIGQTAVRHPDVFYAQDKANDIQVEVALQYTEDIEITEESFANNIYTPEGGTHLTGFRASLTRIVNNYARKNNFLKEGEDNIGGNAVREGIVAVVSVKIKEPEFEGQTKAKLGNPEVKNAVEKVLAQHFNDFLDRNPLQAKIIIEGCLRAVRAQRAAKAARATVLEKRIKGLTLPGKLADCSSRKPEESELFIVEGESAGGCFSGDTKISLFDGRNISFKELIKETKTGKKNYCYTINKEGFIDIAPIKNSRKTKIQTKVVKVILDNKEEIICTPDHLFMLRDGSYKKAKDLIFQDSLMPLYRKYSEIGKGITIKGYEMIFEQKRRRWIFTHILSDQYNRIKGVYGKGDKEHVHHKDFNKLNNNPDNLIRMEKEKHLQLHREMLGKTLHREDVKEKLRRLRRTPEYREKVRKTMTTPKMRKFLSEKAKEQWQDESYKKYMAEKFLEFYRTNERYREENNRRLDEAQKKYWSKKENRERQAQRIREYFITYPHQKERYSQIAKKQWADSKLRIWRSEMTKKQWTPEFRKKRKEAYNQTYLNKAMDLLYNIYQKERKIDIDKYNEVRKMTNDKTLIRYETICQRFFNNDKDSLKEAVVNFNHRVKKIVELKQKMDVYDLEVEGTHNFALASGIFVHNSAKQARNRYFQAILPLRGKILNVEKAHLDRILSSKEIKALIIALGTAIADDFRLQKLRYHRIIIMSDADVDGAHICTLLLTLFYRYFQPIIEQGYLYIAQPPLYQIKKGKQVWYVYNENQKEELLKKTQKPYSIQRYKGLGEMNPDQLWKTTMDPEKRMLKQVIINDTVLADHVFDSLMGRDVMPRKKFIRSHAKLVQNLDI